MSHENYVMAVANVFGANPEDISRVLELSERHKVLYHGVRKRERIYGILQTGKRPSTPEGGRASYWNTGYCLFTASDRLPLSGLATYDSSFFNYAHNTGGMTLLTTDEETLRKIGIEASWRSNASVTIGKLVPPEALSILDLQTERGNIRDPREFNSYVERVILEMLLEHLEKYSPGQRIERKVSS